MEGEGKEKGRKGRRKRGGRRLVEGGRRKGRGKE